METSELPRSKPLLQVSMTPESDALTQKLHSTWEPLMEKFIRLRLRQPSHALQKERPPHSRSPRKSLVTRSPRSTIFLRQIVPAEPILALANSAGSLSLREFTKRRADPSKSPDQISCSTRKTIQTPLSFSRWPRRSPSAGPERLAMSL